MVRFVFAGIGFFPMSNYYQLLTLILTLTITLNLSVTLTPMRPQTDPLYGRSFTLDNCASFSVVRQSGGDDQVKRRCLRSILSLKTSFASLLDIFKFEKLLM